MDSLALAERLSRIQTRWTLLAEAHQPGASAAVRLRQELLQRYLRGAFRYLLAVAKDAELAEELTQEFSVRFLRGDFHGADSERGRFRDYLKTALVNLVRSEQRRRANWPQALPDATPAAVDRAADEQDDFAATWRAELLDRTWQSLARDNASYHAVLLGRIEHPDLSSADLARVLSEKEGREINAALVRKILQRAHRKFAELLVDEVSGSLIEPTIADIERELAELDLVRYCRSILDERRGGDTA